MDVQICSLVLELAIYQGMAKYLHYLFLKRSWNTLLFNLLRGFSHQFALFLVSCRKNAMFLNHNVPKPQGRI